MTQEHLIRKHIISGRPLTKLQALHRYGCMNLGGRIHELRREGYDIQTNMITVRNRNGQKCRVAQYRMNY